MTLLNQIIAVEKGVKTKSEREFTKIHHEITKVNLLSGLDRKYSPKDDEGDHLPPESTLVQLTVPSALATAEQALTRLFDVTATKEYANATAKADVKIDGKVLIADVPVTYLLFLEKQLTHLHTFVSKLPTLDPSEKWTPSTSATGTFETEGAQSTKSKKVPRNHVKAPATDKHPAQVELFHEDVIVGTWTTKKFSGAITADRHAELVSRVEKLQEAVKYAREDANSAEVKDVAPGKAVFGYLFK